MTIIPFNDQQSLKAKEVCSVTSCVGPEGTVYVNFWITNAYLLSAKL